MNFILFEESYRRVFGRPDSSVAVRSVTDDSCENLLEEYPPARRKFKIWKSSQGKCVYCGNDVPLKDFISGIDSDVEHIIPAALGGASVLDNLACSCRSCNHRKGPLTAMDYMLTRPASELSDYLLRLRGLLAQGFISVDKYRLLTLPAPCHKR